MRVVVCEVFQEFGFKAGDHCRVPPCGWLRSVVLAAACRRGGGHCGGRLAAACGRLAPVAGRAAVCTVVPFVVEQGRVADGAVRSGGGSVVMAWVAG
ncbi:hypothetical protein GCM10017581_097840 [Dactylosporangium matsuzakiense]|uniref:Uncharacterized protein n=1 Tax=Dactylosporangium matsuzakiense TaxID=53360 RepID=A0A9W6NSV4_9ACTN|nr:hypothetical protein GCM10017581_097840 [Dactylosporangium matsuzakiense]